MDENEGTIHVAYYSEAFSGLGYTNSSVWGEEDWVDLDVGAGNPNRVVASGDDVHIAYLKEEGLFLASLEDGIGPWEVLPVDAEPTYTWAFSIGSARGPDNAVHISYRRDSTLWYACVPLL